MSPRPPLPPFTEQTARQKVQAAEDAWNTRDPERVAVPTARIRCGGTGTSSSAGARRSSRSCAASGAANWTTRSARTCGRSTADRIAVRFQYESHDAAGKWFRSYGNELWEFDEEGLIRRREASINDMPIDESERRIFGPRPEDERGQSFPLR